MESLSSNSRVAKELTDLGGQLSSALIMVAPDDVDTAITRTVQQVTEAIDGDRGAMFTFSDDEQRIDINYVWHRPGTPPPDIERDAERLPWVMSRLSQGIPVVLQRLPDDLPSGALSEHEWLREFPVKSAALLPVAVAGRRIAVLVIVAFRRYVDFPEEVLGPLRLIAEIMASALHRSRQAQALKQSLADVERLKGHLESHNRYLREEIKNAHGFDEIIGQSAAIHDALSRVQEVAPTDASVMILGETGTGKELIARAIHDRSPRRGKPFISVNCAALPQTLIESELFGHERGAFTGAVTARQGRFELADRGTIFLDEIGDLPADVQVKLLRVLQEREFERLGSATTRRIDVRVISATHRDLDAMAKDGRFRLDLYYRLSVFPIRLPPLRERREDIPLLTWFFIHQRQRAIHRQITSVPDEVMNALQRYAWPGNVRELQNVVERALIRSRDNVLRLDDVLTGAASPAAGPEPDDDSIEAVERAHIERVLAATGWRINGAGNAAERLNLHPNTLRFRMKKLGVVRPRNSE